MINVFYLIYFNSLKLNKYNRKYTNLSKFLLFKIINCYIYLTISGNSVTLFMKMIKNISNEFMISLIKKIIIYFDGPIYFFDNSKNHSSSDMLVQKNVVMFLS